MTSEELKLEDLHLDLSDARIGSTALEQRIAEFKADPQRMQSATEFVNEVLEKAQKEAQAKENAKLISMETDFAEDSRRRVRQWQNRARGFVSRIFQAICNCTKTGGPVSLAKAS